MRIKDSEFFKCDAEKLAACLLGKVLVIKTEEKEKRFVIAETECYQGVEDTACHASRKNPLSARPMWGAGGSLYVYLIYGLHYMLNIVAGKEGDPMAVLIRGAILLNDKNNEPNSSAIIINGPGRVAKAGEITKDFNEENLLESKRIWLEETDLTPEYTKAPRVGINYAEKADQEKPWRFIAYNSLKHLTE